MFEALTLVLVTLSAPSAPPTYVKLAVLLIALHFLGWSPVVTGQLATAWICFQPKLFPITSLLLPLPSFAPPLACVAWVLRGWVCNTETSVLYAPSCTLVVEGTVLMLGVVWRLYLVVMQLRATPPIALATPVLSAIIPLFHYTEAEFYNADGSSDAVVERRRHSLHTLSARWGPVGKRNDQAPSGGGLHAVDRLADVRTYLADTRFTSTFKAFFPFQKYAKSQLDPSFVLDRVTDDNYLVDQDGTKLWDCDCSFGVNVVGYKQYKKFLKNGFEQAKDRSVCLGKLTPQVANNAKRICVLANKEQCSFHMSGTEAIMGAVRLARFNTGRPLICVFGGESF